MGTLTPMEISTPSADPQLVNRVAESAIETLDLAAFVEPIAAFDLAPLLYKGLVLREREFRQALKETDWRAYADQHVAVFCSTDALIPTWAYMLVASKLDGIASSVGAGTEADVRRDRLARALETHDWSVYADKPIVLKGCGNDLVSPDAFIRATTALKGVASKLMYGEPCSSVPVWRKPKAASSTPRAGVKPVGMKPVGPPKA
ncbi:MAG: DUF2480 family protein [Rubricoccaceae bacterium]